MITDTRITIETPEGAELPLTPVSPIPRIAAFFIDSLIKWAAMIIVAIVMSVTGEAGAGLLLIFYFLLEWFYPVAFEVLANGQTPGKKTMKLSVVNDDGTPVGFAASLIRNLLRFVDFLPFAYVVGLVTAVMDRQGRRLGDLAAGTMVVHVHGKRKVPELKIGEKKPVPKDFTLEEQRALLDFAERSSQLSPQRQKELADVLAPILGEGDSVKHIQQMAASLVGGER